VVSGQWLVVGGWWLVVGGQEGGVTVNPSLTATRHFSPNFQF
jgi:hypothetical protein